MPPSRAMAMARRASVTVSMAAETRGILSAISRVSGWKIHLAGQTGSGRGPAARRRRSGLPGSGAWLGPSAGARAGKITDEYRGGRGGAKGGKRARALGRRRPGPAGFRVPVLTKRETASLLLDRSSPTRYHAPMSPDPCAEHPTFDRDIYSVARLASEVRAPCWRAASRCSGCGASSPTWPSPPPATSISPSRTRRPRCAAPCSGRGGCCSGFRPARTASRCWCGPG
jgi:hypothetical protein